jgi:lipid-A-disaccharide synthase
MSRERAVLHVAGEGSGDVISAAIARRLGAARWRCFGMGGAASAAAGVELVADLRGTTGMGTAEIFGRLPALAAAFLRLKRAVDARRPAAAVLVNYTEFNLLLGRWLRGHGVKVLFVVAPQVWAWRASRLSSASTAMDRLAVILPFEEPLWRAAGVNARYVGHPALDAPVAVRTRARDGPARIALLPGSRPAEVRALTVPMLEACRRLTRHGHAIEARVLAAPWLDERARRWLFATIERFAVPAIDVDPSRGAMPQLAGFDASICASGTATLESALAGAAPVVVYRVGRLSAALASRFVHTPHVALPNVLLERRCYPELLQHEVEPGAVADALASVLGDPQRFHDAARELERRLAAGLDEQPRLTMAERCCNLVEDWLCA